MKRNPSRILIKVLFVSSLRKVVPLHHSTYDNLHNMLLLSGIRRELIKKSTLFSEMSVLQLREVFFKNVVKLSPERIGTKMEELYYSCFGYSEFI